MCATLTCPGWFTAADVIMDARSLRDDVAMKDATREDVQGERRHATEDDDAIAEDTARSSIFESGRRTLSERRVVEDG
jgi:hypothetical protein